MKPFRELILILLLAFLVRLPWLAMIPQAEAPDENTHRWVINFISKNMCLPDCQTITRAGSQAVYGSLPSFGYLPHVLLLKLFPQNISKFNHIIVRLASLLMGLIVVAVAYYFGRILFLPNRLAALALPLLIAFHPQFVFVNVYANNDVTTAALSSLILFVLVWILEKGLTALSVMSLTILFSLMILSKYTGYAILFAAGIFLLAMIWLYKERFKSQLLFLLALFSFVVLFTSWWFARNYFQFAGDITGVKTMNDIWVLNYHHLLHQYQTPLPVIFSSFFWRTLFFSFWGWFGYLTRSLPRIFYFCYLAFIPIAIWRAYALWPPIRMNQLTADNHDQNWLRSWIWLLFALCCVSNFSTCVFGCCTGVAGPQGRYLFPSEIPIMAMLVAGLVGKQDKWSNGLLITLLVFNAFVYLYASFYLYQIYRQ